MVGEHPYEALLMCYKWGALFLFHGRSVDRNVDGLLKSLYNEMIHTRKGLDYAQISIS